MRRWLRELPPWRQGRRGFERISQEEDAEAGEDGDTDAEAGPAAVPCDWLAAACAPLVWAPSSREHGAARFQLLLEAESADEAEVGTATGRDQVRAARAAAARAAVAAERVAERLRAAGLGRAARRFAEDLGRWSLAEEVERGGGSEGINPLYYVVYALSVFIFAVGLFMYVMPSISITHRLTGTALFACGLFVLTNSDLLVTSARLAYQVVRLRESTAEFGRHLEANAGELRRLHKAEQGLREVEARFESDVRKAIREEGRLEDISRSSMARCTKHLVRLYCDKNHDQVISTATELDETFALMATAFGAVVPDYSAREALVREGLRGKASVRRDGGVRVRAFEHIMERAMFEPELHRIPKVVRQVLDDFARQAQPPSQAAKAGGA